MRYFYLLILCYTHFLYSFSVSNNDIYNISVDENVILLEKIWPLMGDKFKREKIFSKLKLKNTAINYSSKEYVLEWLRTTEFENMRSLFEVPHQREVPHEKDESWGYTFQIINRQIHNLLTYIAQTYDNSGQRVEVLDLGCGEAWLAPFILMAGGKYRGVEHKKEVAQNANKHIWSTKHLWTKKSENSQDLYKIANVSIFNKNALFKNFKYKVIICNNILHFYTPEKVEEIITLMHACLDPKGLAIIQVDAPRNKELRDIYIKGQLENKEYPGFFIENISSVLYISNFDGKITRSTDKLEFPPGFLGPVALAFPEGYEIEPGHYKKGYVTCDGSVKKTDFNDNKKTIPVLKIPSNLCFNDISELANENYQKLPDIINNTSFGEALEIFSINHYMRNLFTTETLSMVLENNGFIIKESYYFDEFFNINSEEGFRCVVIATRD